MLTLSALPTLNAILNATSAVLLTLGYLFIRAKRILWHTICMMLACGVSAAFLVSYVTYHVHAGVTRFTGQGWIRPVYCSILISHTILAVVIVPLVLRTLFLAIRRRFIEHTRLAHLTLPLWLYVSVTGVLVYVMLYRVSSR